MTNTILLPATVANAIVDDIDPDMEYVVTEDGKDALLGFEDTDRLIFYKFIEDKELEAGFHTHTVRVIIQDQSSEKYYAVQYSESPGDSPVLDVVFPDWPVEFHEVTLVEEIVTTVTKTFSYVE